ncbi:MAG: hypothetical protein ACD_15C00093G0002 [uncultured bacterium]|nr:MAG: hypothetical protein ACD_15C00093G0002 [uncultured bacterium]
MRSDLIRKQKEYRPSIDELPGDLSRLAKVIETVEPVKAVEITLRIAEEFRGTSIYCHNTDMFKRRARDIWIIEEYSNGISVKELALAANISVRAVQEILGKEPK